jgi:hypothetical protein
MQSAYDILASGRAILCNKGYMIAKAALEAAIGPEALADVLSYLTVTKESKIGPDLVCASWTTGLLSCKQDIASGRKDVKSSTEWQSSITILYMPRHVALMFAKAGAWPAPVDLLPPAVHHCFKLGSEVVFARINS